jgi:hypothetical protein
LKKKLGHVLCAVPGQDAWCTANNVPV